MISQKVIVLGMLNKDSKYERTNRVYSAFGLSPTVTARDYKDPPKVIVEVAYERNHNTS